LTCGIPNLKFDRLAFKLDSTNLEVDANRGDVTFCVGIVCKTEEEAGFSNTRVTDEKELEELIVLAGVHVKEGGKEKNKQT